jgi:hypothetical protein
MAETLWDKSKPHIHADRPGPTLKREALDKIRAILPQITGIENIRNSDAIARLAGLSKTRTNEAVRTAMKIFLVEDGIPVLSSTKGFWVATTAAEVREWIERERKRIAGVQRNIRAAEEIARTM